MLLFDRSVCGNFQQAIQKEWLETNGIGGYASSTIIGANTRGYHGLLVAATRPPVGRMVLLSKLEETLIVNGNKYEISCNEYPGVIHPEGYKYLDGFKIDPFPVFTYMVEGIIINKSIFMIQESNTTIVRYNLVKSQDDIVLELRPLIACRDFHSRLHENREFNTYIRIEDGIISIAPTNTRLFLCVRNIHASDGPKAIFETSAYWYGNFEYRIELHRGQEYHEDLYSPGYFTSILSQDDEIALVASTQDPHELNIKESYSYELKRKKSILKKGSGNQNINSLMMAADQFLVQRGNDNLFSVIAGYHWFGDWGRDTMIALPGLTLAIGKYNIARGILKNFAQYCNKGMIPNRFPEAGEKPDYNTVDASLWFIYAVKKYLDYTSDLDFVSSELFHVLTQIIQNYIDGTRYNIYMDSDGLIYAGEEGTQLTWMDAKTDNLVVTPRKGKAVEINALWYNALRITGEIAKQLQNAQWYAKCSCLAEKTRISFNQAFWNESENCLYDCVDGAIRDDSIRPNQIFSISLIYPLLSDEQAKAVLRVVQQELLTPFGLRSLSPRDEKYKGHYSGNQYFRDITYHQGTVWAWLIGHFITAYVNVNGRTKEAKDFARNILSEFLNQHLNEAGLGTISEIFDGDPPHEPRGCIAQAWSVAEVLRAYLEDLKED